jgi:hypothetical protein
MWKPDPKQHADKMRDQAIANAIRILRAYGYEVTYLPWVCNCGRRFATRHSLDVHTTFKNKGFPVILRKSYHRMSQTEPEL